MERGARIKALRKAKGWKQPQLVAAVRAQGSFESASYLSKIEGGQAGSVAVGTFEAIATALDVHNDVILTDRFDADIQRDVIRFLRVQSLERAVDRQRLRREEADAFRTVEETLNAGPLTSAEWEIVRAYASGYAETLRKPGARVESRQRSVPKRSALLKTRRRAARP